MRIQRMVTMNAIEPQQLSMRLPTGMPILIDFLYKDSVGKTLNSDLAAQLQLTARTNGVTSVYAVPATDIVNGKARASIPDGDLTDVNGYNVRLVGTYKQQMMLFATGVVRLVDTLGGQTVPEDVIDNVPISLAYNYDASITVRLWQDAYKSVPFDVSTATISASITASSNSTAILASFTAVSTALAGEVILSMPAATVNTLPPGCWWSLVASTAAGATTLCQGSVSITGVKP